MAVTIQIHSIRHMYGNSLSGAGFVARMFDVDNDKP